MLKFGSRQQRPNTVGAPGVPVLTDPETGLPCGQQVLELLQREVARGLRYGTPMALVAVNVSVVAPGQADSEPAPPSPAVAVAVALRDAIRQADFAGRVGQNQFVAALTECTERDAEQFSERLRTKLSARPFDRDTAGKSFYMRAWAGSLGWTPDYDTAEGYLAAALEKLQATQREFESVQSWYQGDS